MTVPRPRALQGAAWRDVSHLGLALARYLPDEQHSGNPKDDLVRALAGDGDNPGSFSRPAPGFPAGYARYHQHLLRAAAQAPQVTRVLTLHSLSRSVVGLGTHSPLENSLSTHHTYGVPVLTGSALKGLCASFARRNYEGWAADVRGGPYRRVFGYAPELGRQTTETDLGAAGLVTFADALPHPGMWALHREVITTHHPRYYMTGSVPPADWDEPTPVPFLSVSGTFTLLLSAEPGPDAQGALEAVTELLTVALREEGIGAKTSSGFGRFEVQATVPNPAQAPETGGALTPTAAAPSPTAVVPPRFPAWLEADLKAKWNTNQLTNPGSKIHQSAQRLLQETASGTFPADLAREAAQALLQKFSGVPTSAVKKYKWHSALSALASDEGIS